MPVIAKGLDGVVVDNTSVSQVTSETSSLIYRGYRAQDLADQCTFEEVAYLLWHGELPTRAQLADFSKSATAHRNLEPDLINALKLIPKQSHPMDIVRTGVSWLGMEEPDTLHMDMPRTELAALKLLAKIPTIIAVGYRVKKNLPIIAPKSDLPFSENFFNMCFGKIPNADVLKAFEVSMVLYAEHSFNASTFTTRVVTSTLADIYSAVTAGICSLKGPLHGGANEEVMHMLIEIGEPSKAQQWVDDALAQKKKIMGFGHRVYKKQDSRAPTMDRYGRSLAKSLGQTKWHDIASIVEKTMIEKKNIYPNLDFPTGPAYYLMGFDIDFFTPLFVMSRITGWCAHIIEQMKANRLIRPLSEYTGPAEREVKAIEQR
jgi:2-methylcitrate synthase